MTELDSLIESQLLNELQGYRDTEEYQMFQSLIGSKNVSMGRAGRTQRVNMLKKFVKFLVSKGFVRLGQGAFGAVFEHPKLDYAIKIFRNDEAYLRFISYVKANQSNPYLPKFRGAFMKLDDQNYVVRMEKLGRIGRLAVAVDVARQCSGPAAAQRWIKQCQDIADHATPLFKQGGDNLGDMRAARDAGAERQAAFDVRRAGRGWAEMGSDTRDEMHNAHDAYWGANNKIEPIERYLAGQNPEVSFTIKHELFCTTMGEISQLAGGNICLDLHRGNFMRRGDIPVISDPLADRNFF